MIATSRHRRRVLAVVVATGAVLGTAGAATASAAPTSTAAAGSAATTASGPGKCPKTGLLNFSSVFTGGSVKLGKNATVDGSSGKACGVLNVTKAGKLNALVKPANTAFAPVTTKVGLLSFPTTLKVVGNLTGPSGLDAKGLTTTLSGKVVATADIMGSSCDIPLSLSLTTGKSGSLTGKSFVADKKGVQRGVLVDNRFTVPAILPTATCNILVATLSNTLLGLPLAAGESSITYNATIAF